MKKLNNKYKREEVDALIKETKDEYESVMSKQKDRITELKTRLAEVEAELDEYRKRERDIARAFTLATQKAAEIEEAAKNKYAVEIDHLRAFHEKWRAYYAKLIKTYPIDSKLAEIQEFDRQMTRVFTGEDSVIDDSPDEVYHKEKSRVSSAKKGAKPAKKAKDEIAISVAKEDDEPFMPPASIVSYLNKEREQNKARRAIPPGAIPGLSPDRPIPPSSSGFSFEEALNPTQDLDEIMRDLGLDFDGDLD